MSSVDAVIITGAGQGIGKAVALDLGGKSIPALCISKSPNADATKQKIIKNGGKAESLIIDISNYELTTQLVSEWISKKTYTRLGVILAAAILGPSDISSAASIRQWDLCYKVNVLGNLATLSGLLPRMMENKFGRIIAFAGGGSAYAYPNFPAYSASKTAMVRTVENIHESLKEKGDFSIVCLAPGAVETETLKQIRERGGEVRTTVNISEPVRFISNFINSTSRELSGRFIHVRDNWKDYIKPGDKINKDSQWKLRRIEL